MDDPDRGMENARELADAKLANAIRSAVADTLNRNLAMVELTRAMVSTGFNRAKAPVSMYEKSDIEQMIKASAANLAMVITELVRQ